MAERRVEWRVKLVGAREAVRETDAELNRGSARPVTWRARISGAREAARAAHAEAEADSRANPIDLRATITNAQAAALRARAQIAATLQRIPATVSLGGAGLGGIGGGGQSIGIGNALSGSAAAAGSAVQRLVSNSTGLAVSLLRVITVSSAVSTGLAALITVLGQLSIVLLAAIRDLGSLSGALLLLPGAISVVGAAVGALKLGLRGLPEALQAKAAAAKQASSGLEQLTTATEQQSRAQADYKTAVEDAARALLDLQSQERDLLAQRRSAEGDLADAEERKRQAALNAYGKASDTRRANDDIAAAKARIGSTYDALAKNSFEQGRNRAGLDPSVVSARRSLADATKAIATAQATAAGTSAALTSELNKLAPAARALYDMIGAVSPRWLAVQQRVQESLLKGSAGWLKQLTDAYAPIVEEGLSAVAGSLNGWGSAITDYLVDPQTRGIVGRILTNVSRALTASQPGVVSLLDAFLQTADVGVNNIATRLAPAFSRGAQRLSAWVEKAAADGTLDRWINTAEDAIGKIGSIATTLWDVLSRLSDAAGNNSFLDMLLRVVQRADEWLSKPENFAAAQKLFETLSSAFDGAFVGALDTLGELLPVLADAALAAAPGINLIITSLGDFLRDHGGEVSQVVGLLADYLGQLASGLLPVLGALLPGVIDLLSQLTTGGANSPVAQFLGAIVQIVQQAQQSGLFESLGAALGGLAVTLATYAPQIAEQLIPALIGLLQFIAQNPALVAGLAAGVAALAAAFALFAPILGPVVGPLLTLLMSPALAEALPYLAGALLAVAAAFGLLAAGFVGAWRNGTLGADWDALSAAAGRLMQALGQLNASLGIDWGKLLDGGLDLAGQAFDAMILSISAMINKLAGLSTVASGVLDIIKGDAAGGLVKVAQGSQQSRNAYAQAAHDWGVSKATSAMPQQAAGRKFASGGYSESAVHNSTWGEDGAEAVLPLTNQRAMQGIADSLATPIASALSRIPQQRTGDSMQATNAGMETLLRELITVVRGQGENQARAMESLVDGFDRVRSGMPALPGHSSTDLRTIGQQRGSGSGVV